MKFVQIDLLELATDLGLIIDTVNARVILADRLYAGHNDWTYGDLEGELDEYAAVREAIITFIEKEI